MTTTSYMFRAFDQDGNEIAQSNGRAGAYTKVMDALASYRAAVASGSGSLHGNPSALGQYSVDGVRQALGPTAYLMGAEDEIARLDRLGVERVAQIVAEVEANA